MNFFPIGRWIRYFNEAFYAVQGLSLELQCQEISDEVISRVKAKGSTSISDLPSGSFPGIIPYLSLYAR